MQLGNALTGSPRGAALRRGLATTTRDVALAAAITLLAAGCGTSSGSQGAPGPSSTAAAAGQEQFATPQVLATGLKVPWSLAFLPDGSALVSERETGRILRISPDGGKPEVVATVPGVVAEGEGGLLGIAVSRSYARDRLIYAYFTSATDNRIVRLRPGGTPEVLLDGIPKSVVHNGGRIAFGPDGLLYAGTGDATEPGAAPVTGRLNGKILRIEPDGQVPPDNPFPGSPVYSRGHRNVQGLAWDGAGHLYASELGQDAWDEVNLIVPGANYGWPMVEGRQQDGAYSQPVVTWPVEAASPSGMAFFEGALYVAALRGERLWRVPLTGEGKAGRPEALFAGEFGRLRDVTVAPDGSLWLLTSNRDGRGEPVPQDDRVIRLPPAR